MKMLQTPETILISGLFQWPKSSHLKLVKLHYIQPFEARVFAFFWEIGIFIIKEVHNLLHIVILQQKHFNLKKKNNVLIKSPAIICGPKKNSRMCAQGGKEWKFQTVKPGIETV